MNKKNINLLARLFGSFVLLNLVIFAVYRVFFLNEFAAESTYIITIESLQSGVRLDIALLGVELAIFTIGALLTRRIGIRATAMLLWSLTFIHVFYSIINFTFFKERNIHAAEMVLAYITSPIQLYLATIPFVERYPYYSLTAMLLCIVYFHVGIRKSRNLAASIRIIPNRKHWLFGTAIALFFLSFSINAITVKTNRSAKGWQLKPLRSAHLTNSKSFIHNQSVINPVHELLFVNLPSSLKESVPYFVDQDEALSFVKNQLGIQNPNDNYPLLRTVDSKLDTQVENVVIIQLEGLTASIFEHEENGQKVMPFLNNLSENSIYFPNAIQSFNATAGSIFSTVTGFHKNAFDEKTRRFISSELNGYFGSLARLIGRENYEHFYLSGFRHSSLDFETFMGNQGYTALGYSAWRERLANSNRTEPFESALGIDDFVFLEESAHLLLDTEKYFTAHLMTSTTHSPWKIPESHFKPFAKDALNAFHYLDNSIEAFFDIFKKNEKRFKETLFVITSDHTSITFSNSPLERVRIPLIFFMPGEELTQEQFADTQFVSHVDILPSILSLLEGRWDYSGLGRSLFDKNASLEKSRGIVSGSRYQGLYLKDDYLFLFKPYEISDGKHTNLYRIENNAVVPNDLSEDNPVLRESLKWEYLSLYETSKRLAVSNRAFPLQQNLMSKSLQNQTQPH